MKTTESAEMYLETILVLSEQQENVRAIDIVHSTGYTKPSVSRAVGLLKAAGRIEVDDSGYITLTEGKYHQIKRMVAATGNNAVVYLERIRFADIPLDPSLARGEWRMLTDGEIAGLIKKAEEK